MTRGVLALFLIAGIALLAIPQVFTQSSTLTILNQMAITVVFALSYNMLLGQGGMLSFGHAVYMGLGGFLVVHLMGFVEIFAWPIPLPIVPLFGGLFGLGIATLVGSFSVARAGTVFAMISLGIGELVAALSLIIVAFFGGEEGVSADRTYGLALFGVEYLSQLSVYYLTAAWLFVCAFAMYWFTQTAAGRLANAVRDNPSRVEFLGYGQRQVRFVSFCAAGFFAGIAGGLFAINYEIVTEENLNLASSGTVLLAAYLGGVGHFVGPIIGAVLFTWLQSVVSLHTELWQLYVGLLFVLMVMFVPGGIAAVFEGHWRRFRQGDPVVLVRAYIGFAVPTFVALVSGIVLVEMAHHWRFSPSTDTQLSVFRLNLSTADWRAWVLALIGLLGGGGIALWRWPSLRQRWIDTA